MELGRGNKGEREREQKEADLEIERKGKIGARGSVHREEAISRIAADWMRSGKM